MAADTKWQLPVYTRGQASCSSDHWESWRCGLVLAANPTRVGVGRREELWDTLPAVLDLLPLCRQRTRDSSPSNSQERNREGFPIKSSTKTVQKVFLHSNFTFRY